MLAPLEEFIDFSPLGNWGRWELAPVWQGRSALSWCMPCTFLPLHLPSAPYACKTLSCSQWWFWRTSVSPVFWNCCHWRTTVMGRLLRSSLRGTATGLYRWASTNGLEDLPVLPSVLRKETWVRDVAVSWRATGLQFAWSVSSRFSQAHLPLGQSNSCGSMLPHSLATMTKDSESRRMLRGMSL